jgi:hypothetical protein
MLIYQIHDFSYETNITYIEQIKINYKIQFSIASIISNVKQ